MPKLYLKNTVLYFLIIFISGVFYMSYVLSRLYVVNYSSEDLQDLNYMADFSTIIRNTKTRDINIVSYSFFGDDAGFSNHLDRNIFEASIFYPNFEVHIYSDYKGLTHLERLSSFHKNLKLINIAELNVDLKNVNPRMWRFYPIGQPNIKVILFRDSDSIILPREVDAVYHWLNNSTAILHVMRDNPMHTWPILAGMFGLRVTKKEDINLLKNLRDKIFRRGNGCTYKSCDQNIIGIEIWENLRRSSVQHDSYSCQSFPYSIPFPTKRDKMNFVGAVYVPGQVVKLPNPCPVPCRPIDHQDWEYC